MGDAKKAHTKLKATEWAAKAEQDNEDELEKLMKSGQQDRQAKGGNTPMMGGNQKIEIAKAAGKKAVAAAKKDSDDLLDLLENLDEAQNPGRDKKVNPSGAKDALNKIIAIGRKHSVPEATIRQALKNTGYQA